MGQIIWINGLAGAGKSTTARALCAKLEELQKEGKLKQKGVIYTDGDDFRAIFEHKCYDKNSRIEIAKKRIALSLALAKQGFCVVDTAIALFDECYKHNRQACQKAGIKYTEIFINCSIEVLENRDQKGLYSGAKAGKQKDVVGMDIAYDKPNANLTLDGTGNVEKNIDEIVRLLGK